MCTLLSRKLSASADPLLAEAVLRFLASTTSISKTLHTREGYERRSGLRLHFDPAQTLRLRQSWMREPLVFMVQELLIDASGREVRTWVLQAEGSVIELRGGRLAELTWGRETELCGA